MKFAVRYWSSLLASEYRGTADTPHWVDYSIHPASKLGLHNALLAVHDRNEILAAHGGLFECAVFAVTDKNFERLSVKDAEALFSSLPRGEVKWLDISTFLLPATSNNIEATASQEETPQALQMPLFEHIHTPYDDADEPPHALDIDI